MKGTGLGAGAGAETAVALATVACMDRGSGTACSALEAGHYTGLLGDRSAGLWCGSVLTKQKHMWRWSTKQNPSKSVNIIVTAFHFQISMHFMYRNIVSNIDCVTHFQLLNVI